MHRINFVKFLDAKNKVNFDELGLCSTTLTTPSPRLQLHVVSAGLTAALYFFSSYQQRLLLAQLTVDQLARLSSTDGLTSLPNRRGMATAIGGELAGAIDRGGGFALILFDIDHFKAINDKFGHALVTKFSWR